MRVCQPHKKTKEDINKVNKDTLTHTRWCCKNHIVFAPKYRIQTIYRKSKVSLVTILKKLCERNGVEIITASACVDHVHIVVDIPPKISVSSFIGYLKGNISLMIFERYANLRN